MCAERACSIKYELHTIVVYWLLCVMTPKSEHSVIPDHAIIEKVRASGQGKKILWPKPHVQIADFRTNYVFRRIRAGDGSNNIATNAHPSQATTMLLWFRRFEWIRDSTACAPTAVHCLCVHSYYAPYTRRGISPPPLGRFLNSIYISICTTSRKKSLSPEKDGGRSILSHDGMEPGQYVHLSSAFGSRGSETIHQTCTSLFFFPEDITIIENRAFLKSACGDSLQRTSTRAAQSQSYRQAIHQ